MDTGPLKYNPGVLGDSELIKSFVVRHKCLELILESLKENAASASSNRHLLVVGPRGIGKTMLVRRVAAEVRSNEDFGRLWFPVVYGEESYQVSSAGEFWLEALYHLSDNIGGGELRRTVDELREEHKDATLRERALSQLLEFADSRNKRLLLVVENLNMLCEQISSDATWELRHTLTNEPRIMFLGTATSRFDAITNADQAWFELFAIHDLKPLDRQESHTLWRSVANQDLKPGHVRAIRILTGGNPRLLTVLASFAAKHSFRELMEQLVHLIDDHTEYFKGHLDALPIKERKVFVSLLESWNPSTAADLARAARMGVNEVSALLSRLVARGAVELFERRPRRKLYQAAERLYNIYYLMRRRGQPGDRVRAAVSFMVMFYGGRQLATTIAELAREACGLPVGKSEDHFVAYAELVRRAPRDVGVRALDETPPEFFCRPDVPETLRPLKTFGAFKRASVLLKAERWSEAELAFREVLDVDADLGPVWNLLGTVIEKQNRPDEAEKAWRKSIELDPKQAEIWNKVGLLLAKSERIRDAEQAYRAAINAAPKDPCGWHHLGDLLSCSGRHKAAIEACQRAIEMDPNHGEAWSDYGGALFRRGWLKRAETAFRRAIELDAGDAWTWEVLAKTLWGRNLYDEAKRAYRRAIDLNPKEPALWSDFGHLLVDAGPPEESETFWNEALKLYPTLAPCAVHLLQARLERGVERDVVLREAEDWIERSGRDAHVLDAMGRFIVGSHLIESFPQAEKWAMESVSKAPGASSSEVLALVLAAQGKWTEALQASGPLADAAGDSDESMAAVTNLLIQAAAAGYGQQAKQLLAASKSTQALESLFVGLQVYLGETPPVAKEILEIGRDVAEQIREVAAASKPS
jgi:tetratricopeptide (TPR) repeat protein